jgi:hypothetical protein
MLVVVSPPNIAGATMKLWSGLGAADSIGSKDSKDIIHCNMQLYREALSSSLAGLHQVTANRA